jgi:uncharacterized protein YdhG (YjbR/CyaY superfamily)
MDRNTHESVDDYLAAQPLPARRVLQRVRTAIRSSLPGAVEGISYQIPVYKLNGRMVVYFAGFQRHYSIYPATARVVDALKDELAGRVHSKATIRFEYEDAVPTRLITRIVKLRAAEAAAGPGGPARKTSTRRTRKATGTTRARTAAGGRARGTS